jgi:hypothetical protein
MNYCYIVPKDNELYHHGVKGMHWGIRRYQNQNGSLTSEGRAHMKEWKQKEIARRTKGYAKLNKKLNKRAEKLINKRAKIIMKGKSTDKINEKIRKNDTNLKINKALEKAEVKKIRSMKLADISYAKRAKAGYAVKTALKHIGKTSLAALGGAASVGVALGTAVEGAATGAAIAGANIGGGIAIGGLGGSIYGNYRTIKSTATSKRKFSNLSANERAKIISRYLKKK